MATRRLPLGRAIVPAERGRPVGAVTVTTLPAEDEIHVGWYLHPDHVGRGWATQAARLVVDDLLSLGRRVWAVMWPNNAPSAGVCTRLGFQDLGERDDPWFGTAEYRTSRIFVTGADAAAAIALIDTRLRTATFPSTDAEAP